MNTTLQLKDKLIKDLTLEEMRYVLIARDCAWIIDDVMRGGYNFLTSVVGGDGYHPLDDTNEELIKAEFVCFLSYFNASDDLTVEDTFYSRQNFNAQDALNVLELYDPPA